MYVEQCWIQRQHKQWIIFKVENSGIIWEFTFICGCVQRDFTLILYILARLSLSLSLFCTLFHLHVGHSFLSFLAHKQLFTLLDYRHRYNHLIWFLLFHLNYMMMILFCGRINYTMYCICMYAKRIELMTPHNDNKIHKYAYTVSFKHAQMHKHTRTNLFVHNQNVLICACCPHRCMKPMKKQQQQQPMQWIKLTPIGKFILKI